MGARTQPQEKSSENENLIEWRLQKREQNWSADGKTEIFQRYFSIFLWKAISNYKIKY